MLADHRIADQPENEKLYSAFLAFLAMRAAFLVTVLSVLISLFLIVFSTAVYASFEIITSVLHLWQGSSHLERLIILVIIWLFLKKMYPYVVRFVQKRGF